MEGLGIGSDGTQTRVADVDASNASSTAPLVNLPDELFHEVLAHVPDDDLLALDHTHSWVRDLLALRLFRPHRCTHRCEATTPSSTGGGTPPRGGETKTNAAAAADEAPGGEGARVAQEGGGDRVVRCLQRPSDLHIVKSISVMEWARALGWRFLWLERDQVWRDKEYSGEIGDACCLAAKGGSIAVLQDALQGGATLTVRAIEAAARGGHLDMVEHLVDHFVQGGVAWDDTEGACLCTCTETIETIL